MLVRRAPLFLPALAAIVATFVVAGVDIDARDIVRVVVVACWLLAAAMLFRTRVVAGVITLAGATAGAIAALADVVARAPSSSASTADGAHLAVGIGIGLAGASVFHLLLALPDGFGRGRFVKLLVVVVSLVGAGTGALAFVDRPDVHWVSLIVVGAIAGGYGLWYSNGRYHNASALDQRGMQWLGLSIVVAVELSIVVVALRVIADWPRPMGTPLFAMFAVVALGLGAASTRRLLARVDRALAYAVSFTGLTSMVLVVYVIVVISRGHSLSHDERNLLLVSMAGAGVAALAYPVARARLEGVANRLVYGERVAPDETIRKFGSRLTRAIPMDELLLQLCESLRKSFRLRSAEVWTGRDGRLEVAAGTPHRDRPVLTVNAKSLAVVARAGVSGGTWLDIWLPELIRGRGASADVRVAPLAHGGELLGLIVCERFVDGEPFNEDGDLTLTELSRQVALALHNVNLDSALQASLDELEERNADLQESRARIVAAGDAERRKLERNLHDGAQQHLVALAVKVRLARDAVEDDPADALSLLDELKGDLQGAIAELRALAHGIFPPLLMSGGLAQALPAAATRSTLTTTVHCEDVERHSADIEAAVYFCCLEAIQNANKHAGESAQIDIRLWREPADQLCFEVADNGAGFDAAGIAGRGHGFINMADRVGAMRGTLEVESTAGSGTRIRGCIPVGS